MVSESAAWVETEECAFLIPSGYCYLETQTTLRTAALEDLQLLYFVFPTGPYLRLTLSTRLGSRCLWWLPNFRGKACVYQLRQQSPRRSPQTALGVVRGRGLGGMTPCTHPARLAKNFPGPCARPLAGWDPG